MISHFGQTNTKKNSNKTKICFNNNIPSPQDTKLSETKLLYNIESKIPQRPKYNPKATKSPQIKYNLKKFLKSNPIITTRPIRRPSMY